MLPTIQSAFTLKLLVYLYLTDYFAIKFMPLLNDCNQLFYIVPQFWFDYPSSFPYKRTVLCIAPVLFYFILMCPMQGNGFILFYYQFIFYYYRKSVQSLLCSVRRTGEPGKVFFLKPLRMGLCVFSLLGQYLLQ